MRKVGKVQLEDMICNALDLIEELLKSSSIAWVIGIMDCTPSSEDLYVDVALK